MGATVLMLELGIGAAWLVMAGFSISTMAGFRRMIKKPLTPWPSLAEGYPSLVAVPRRLAQFNSANALAKRAA